MGRNCYVPISAVGSSNFITALNGTVVFDSYAGEYTNTPECGESCFSIQMNSNRFDNYAWLQIITVINYSDPYGLATYIDYQIYWLNSVQPSAGCQAGLGWQSRLNPVSGEQVWICDNRPSSQWRINSTGPFVPATSRFSTLANFYENGTVRVRLQYYYQGISRISDTLDVTTGLSPYGQILSAYQVVVGAAGGRATFSPGAKVRLYLTPTTSIGGGFDVGWDQGGTVFETAESSNLTFSNATVVDDAQLIRAQS
jgi:hypothetical protein